MSKTKRATAAEEWEREERELIAHGAAKLIPPWQPIADAPRDGREMIGLWIDIDETWNVEMVVWSDGNNCFMTHGGMLMPLVVGWMPRPPLPGEARQP